MSPVARGRSVFVLGILGIFAVLAALKIVPRLTVNHEQARRAAAQMQIDAFESALRAFVTDNGFYPAGGNGLSNLLQAPRDATHWHGPYLQGEIPLDPWGRPYVYEQPGKHRPATYDLVSMGPNGRIGDDDDITNWQQKK